MTSNQKTLTGTVFGIIIGITGTFYYFQVQDFNGLFDKRSGPVPIEEAHTNIKAYQDPLAYTKLALYPKAKVHGVLHDTTSIKNYYELVFKKFVDSHTPKAGYHWEIGLYPNVSYDRKMEKNRLNIYFIPTMARDTYQGNEDDILEYYKTIKSADSKYYDPTKSSWQLGDSYIFDQGTLFP